MPDPAALNASSSTAAPGAAIAASPARRGLIELLVPRARHGLGLE